MTISGEEQQEAEDKDWGSLRFGFYVAPSKDVIPRDDLRLEAAPYATHIQTSSTCQVPLPVAIWNPKGNPSVTLNLAANEFSLSEEANLLSTQGKPKEVRQTSISQTFRFFNWSSRRPLSLRMRAHGPARLYIDHVSSEEAARALTRVAGRPTAN